MENPQGLAADTASSIWVSASAGTGKTTVLVRRVSRMLLEGCDPARILCITYTKAAAAEMHERLMQKLKTWAVADDAALAAMLRQDELPLSFLPRAKKLFAILTEHPTGLIIQTIHSFCQSILQRFPIEAGLPTSFTVLEEGEAGDIWQSARRAQHHAILTGREPELEKALHWLYAHDSQKEVDKWLHKQAYNHRARLLELYGTGLAELRRHCRDTLGVPETTPSMAMEQAFTDSAIERETYQHYTKLLLDSDNKDNRSQGNKLHRWLSFTPSERAEEWQPFHHTFLTKDESSYHFKPRKFARTVAKNFPEMDEWFTRQAETAMELTRIRQSWNVAEQSACYALLGADMAKHYENGLMEKAGLDYDALIHRTLNLLSSQNQAWVRYKLDGGFEHILLDEAQDTSPTQWSIMRFLAEGLTERSDGRQSGELRTLFVVGDRKQSIYSFQGADPDHYAAQEPELEKQHRFYGIPWQRVPFTRNFRSAAPVLELVDRVFASAESHHGLGENDICHQAARMGAAGHVECWPLMAITREEQNRDQAMALLVASTIEGWLQSRRMLPARGRPVEPGDILILLRKRGALPRAILQQLQARGIPTAGLDRLSVHEHLAVRDLLGIASWALLPDDDMLLALLLRSPFFDLPEETLFRLAHERGGQSLWQRLKHEAESEPGLEETVSSLHGILQHADWMPAYEFYHRLLEGMGFANRLIHRLGPEAADLCHEFLSMTLEYESRQPPSLQGFTRWMHGQEQELKRELGNAPEGVRIMTVHGAKGLQAPIVIMPDAGNPQQNDIRALWLNGCLIANPGRGRMLPLIHQALEQEQERYRAERNRLLYVALTRAEEELYVGGTRLSTSKSADETTWHYAVHKAMQGWAEAASMPPMQNGLEWWKEKDAPFAPRMRFSTPQTSPVSAPSILEAQTTPLPAWLTQATKHPAIIAPAITNHRQTVLSLLEAGAQDESREEGILIHLLLQLLPDLPMQERRQAAFRHMRHLPQDEAGRIWQSVECCLHAPELEWLWSARGAAEIPITGVLAGRLLECRIDRLWKDESNIRIVDFKTTPHIPDAAPPAYRQQLRQYGELARLAWPDHKVELYLLWTHGCRLMPVDF